METVEPTDSRLGQLVSTHPVSSRRRWATGGTALGIALVGGIFMAYLISAPVDGRGFGRALGLALVLLAGGLLVAAVQLPRAVRGGRQETFELYENGLAHLTSGARRSWTWQQVSSVQVKSNGDDDTQAGPPIVTIPRYLGWNLRCSVRFADGSRVRIDGLTTDGLLIADALVDRCAAAVAPPDEMAAWRVMRWALPAIAVICAGTLVFLSRYVITHDEKTVRTGPNSSTVVPALSDSVLAALAAVAIICLTGLALSLSMFIMTLISRRKQR